MTPFADAQPNRMPRDRPSRSPRRAASTSRGRASASRSRSPARGRASARGDDGDDIARAAAGRRSTRSRSRSRSRGVEDGEIPDARADEKTADVAPSRAKASTDALARPPSTNRATKTGGTYVPPFKLAQMMRETTDKTSAEYQRMSWDALKKSINGLVNKVNASNVQHVVPEMFRENLIRGRGLFARSVMKSQMASPQFSGVFAALVAVVNTKFPEIGELVIKRCVLQFRRAYKRNDKPVCVAATRFLAALINQQVRGQNRCCDARTNDATRRRDKG
jgi:pre-mRNA-splicing factor CWC22